ncbi:MAG TPA: N-acetylmuramoyl-L-alanine amidase [Candidatus Acidoferrales bacterium]|nr:N-acetylmuramoyl-L-alanine amidase [Candidatus Acidoferrales bacterium]
MRDRPAAALLPPPPNPALPFFAPHTNVPPRQLTRFDILLFVTLFRAQRKRIVAALPATLALTAPFLLATWSASSQAPSNPQTTTTETTPRTPPATQPAPPREAPSVGLNIVILDPAHGGTDLGARGTEGIRESEVVLQFATQVRRALEAQGFQVIQTREGNENPSFDDRSARANAQRGAVFITLHIASTGLAGTVRTYVMPESPALRDPSGLIPWDQAQLPFEPLSHKLGDMVQAELARRFKGSPDVAQMARIRQLRTTAAPAIAVEISSVSVENRADLDRMIPGVADAIAHGVAAFRPSYVVPVMPGTPLAVQP